jgi:hypothetical protein
VAGELLGAGVHAGDAHAETRLAVLRGDTATVVCDRHNELCIDDGKLDGDAPRMGMAIGVQQGLLDDP